MSTTDFINSVTSAATAGTPANFDVTGLVTPYDPTNSTSLIQHIPIDFSQAGVNGISLASIATVFGFDSPLDPGTPVVLPQSDWDTLCNNINLSSVELVINSQTFNIYQLTVWLAFNDAVATIDVFGLTLTITDIMVSISSPQGSAVSVSVELIGTIAIQNPTMAAQSDTSQIQFALTVPEGRLEISLTVPSAGPDLGTVVAALGLSDNKLDGYAIGELDFVIDFSTKTVAIELGASLVQANQGFLDPNSGLTLDDFALTLSASETANGLSASASFSTDFIYTNKAGVAIPLSAMISYTDNPSVWTVYASAGAAGVQSSLSGGPATGGLSLLTLAQAFDLDTSGNSADLSQVFIDYVTASATIDEGGTGPATDFSFAIAAHGSFTLDGYAFNAGGVLSLIRSNSGGSYSTSGSVQLWLDFDGINLSAMIDFGGTSDTIAITAVIGAMTASATYTTGSPVVITLTAATGYGLGDLLGDIYGAVTGNPNVQLSDPWDVLNEITLDAIALTIDFSTQTITASVTVSASALDGLITVNQIDVGYCKNPTAGASRFFVNVHSTALSALGMQNPTSLDPTAAASPSAGTTGTPLVAVDLVVAGFNAELSQTAIADVGMGLSSAAALIAPPGPESGQIALPRVHRRPRWPRSSACRLRSATGALTIARACTTRASPFPPTITRRRVSRFRWRRSRSRASARKFIPTAISWSTSGFRTMTTSASRFRF